MSDHVSIGDLERLRRNEHADDRSGERSLEEIQAHLATCGTCRTRLDELEALDGLASRVRDLSTLPATERQSTPEIPGYDISHEIHRGGQGIVYAATQHSTGRQVAIKVLLHGSLASENQRVRFEREIDLAARINHPNVVTIIDRGQTHENHGYLVMELIDGPTLDGFLNEHPNCSIEQRLRLFMEICSGVQAAHQRGVLHRDLKPANILIDQSNRPRVLDFGLARDDLDNSTTRVHTAAGEFMGTLAYAAPEQLRGDPGAIDARTDIYALGVLLYELLTGQLPHDMSGSIDVVIKRVLEQTPNRPTRINPKLDADLDTVVLHALEHGTDRRYPSVDALSADIRAVLEHRPIQARRASTAYQLRKFARRHRTGVAVTSVLLLGMVGTIAGLGIGIIRTNAANAIAEQRRVEAEIQLDKQLKVSRFFNDLLAEVDPGQSGPDMRVTELLDVASMQVEQQFGQYPDLQGNLQMVMGETYTRLGSYAQAEAQLTAAIEALGSIDPLPRRTLGATFGVLSQVQIATTRLEEAAASLDRAESLVSAIDDGEDHGELSAQLLHQRGALLYEEGDFDASIDAYRQALDLLDELEGDGEKRVAAQAFIGLGVSLKRLERFDEALEADDAALILLNDVHPENHPDTLACLSNRAEVLNNLGRVEEAEAQLFDLLERRRAVFGPTHERVGLTLNNLADSLRARAQYAQAAELFDEAISIFREKPGDPSLRLAITIHNAGVMHLEQSNLLQAQAMLEEAAVMSKGLLPQGHWIAAQFSVKWAECLMLQGETQNARALLEPARTALAGSLGEDHRRVAHAQQLLDQLGDATD